MTLQELHDGLRGRQDALDVRLEGMRLRVVVRSEIEGEEMIDTIFRLLGDQLSTVWIPGLRVIEVVVR